MPLWALYSCLSGLAVLCVFLAWGWWDTSNLYERELGRAEFLRKALQDADEVIERLSGLNSARREREG